MSRLDKRLYEAKCPDQIKGEYCDVCGGSYICLEPWRKKRTKEQRKKEYMEYKKEAAK